MVYIIFLNPTSSVPASSSTRPGSPPLSAGTALIAGIVTIAMGVFGNYPLALAAGLGINGIVAFSLTSRA